ncbi:MAG: hypothetical protein HY348_04100 [Nitrospira defluvii]|nr:hypothetical protein [Nitrospira defluvii]
MGIRGYFSTCNGVGDRDFEYLRLFGFLNACYLQVGAVERLCAIVNIHGKKTIVGDLRSYELIQCRNMLASHTVAYKVGDSVQSITIEQCSLGRAGATFIINETGERRLCSFRELYSSWAKAVRSALIAIVTKFIKTVFKTNADRRAEHLATLSVLVGAAAE